MACHVRKGDMVMVRSGDRTPDGKRPVGEVLRVIPKRGLVVVKGVNVVTKHLRPTRTAPQGGVITREAPIHISKVSPVVDGLPTRVRFETRPDGSKVRVAAKGGKVLGVVSPAAKTESKK